MTDEEILKRLAEIEGWTACESISPDRIPYTRWRDLDENTWIYESVNPLHNDAQCLALVKKYHLSLEYLKDYDGAWLVGGIEYDPSLNRAVCLAIIEAHK